MSIKLIPLTELTSDVPDPRPESNPLEALLAREAAGVADLRVRRMLRLLPDIERRVVSLRVGLNGDVPLTQAETGSRLGLSERHVRRLEQSAFARLRAYVLRTARAAA